MKSVVKQKVEEYKKHTILEEVSKYFETNGFNNATIQDISQCIGISVGSLYKLFASKEELFYAYITYQRELFYARLTDECKDVEDPTKCLEIFVRHKFEAFTTKRMAFLDLILKDPLFLVKLNMSTSNPVFLNIKILEKWFQDICKKENLRESDPLKLAYIFNATINGYVEYWLNGGLLPENIEDVIKNFFNGLKQ